MHRTHHFIGMQDPNEQKYMNKICLKYSKKVRKIKSNNGTLYSILKV